MFGRFYLPTFLFRVGLLTLIYIASFMALAILCPSLPIILKLSTVVVWPVVFWCSKIGEGVLNVLCIAPQMFLLTPLYIYHTFSLATLKPVYGVTLFCYFIIVFCEHQ